MPTSSNPAIDQTCFESPATVECRRAGEGPDRRNSRVDRRTGMERRVTSAQAAGYDGVDRRLGEDRRQDTGLERRRGP